MNARIAVMGVFLLGCLGLAAATARNDPPTPSPSPCTKSDGEDDILSFKDASAGTKQLVLDFRHFDSLKEPDCTRWGYSPDDNPATQIGLKDSRSPIEHFKKFDHPHVQPRPGESVWRTYLDVPNLDIEANKRYAVPKACRPDDESWLNRKRADDGAAPPECLQSPAAGFRFKSLPLIRPSDSIKVTYVQTPQGIFPAIDPFKNPPGTNMLPTISTDIRDGDDLTIPNSLPSTTNKPYNLHDGDPVVTPINPRSPTNDLQEVLDTTYTLLTGSSPKRLWEQLDRAHYEDLLVDLKKRIPEIKANRPRINHYLKRAIDIIEGEPVSDRAYSGLPLLHHSGHKRVRRIVPILGRTPFDPPKSVGPAPWISDEEKKAKRDDDPRKPNVVGGNAQVHQVWFDGRIESDTMFLDGKGEFDGCQIQVNRLKAGSPIPQTTGRNLMIVYEMPGVRHFQLFDREGHEVLDENQKNDPKKVQEVARLTKVLDELKEVDQFNRDQRATIAAGVAAVVENEFAKICAAELSLPPIPPNVPWTVTYTVDVLDRGRDDFATTTMFLDSHNATERYFEGKDGKNKESLRPERNEVRTLVDVGAKLKGELDIKKVPHFQLPLVSMDQTFYPMESGTRTVLTVKMPPPEYHNLTYTWGWRVHPPRAQAMENAGKRRYDDRTKSVVDYEHQVFGDNPVAAIKRLGDLAPAKRMWRAFHHVRDALGKIDSADTTAGEASLVDCLTQILDARNAFLDWKDRTHLPSGLKPDPASDLTVLFVNNTTYGEFKSGAWTELKDWRLRDHPVKVTLINADYFPHQYLNVEWGGNRGWEPQYKPTLRNGGSGTFFSFGRFHYQFTTPPGKIEVPPARRFRANGDEIKVGDDDEVPAEVRPGVHRLWLNMRHEPSRRLRFYQFDPTHHDVAIFSVH